MPGTRLSDAARDALETLYAENSFPDVAARQALADEQNIEARQVQIWFQNKRQRMRMKANGPAVVRRRAASGATASQQHGHVHQLARVPLDGSIAKSIAKPQAWPQAWKQHGVPMGALDVLAYAASVVSETDATDVTTSDADASDAEHDRIYTISPSP